MSIYDYNVTTIDHNEVSLDEYKGKVVLIVNTASKCGFTPQYEGLQSLYESYHTKGLEILAFPCNQFMNQEPGTNEDIKQFCSINYNVTFKILNKVDVNGENTHPLYNYLKSRKKGVLGGRVKWNFTKFLVDKNGEVVKRFAPTTPPDKIKKFIEVLLTQ
ncbi:glutathione peroxidase [Haloplasma contractile]|uniref:Glutathione peroxidase n=1 Tax=Haloplasma contractile SSD-17B TaxID=1033810 RepID=F7PUB2_9MOLU|nr:glutathione peroxidase [Haloplasma contractile]ERJ11702.1 Glutathione peroxidase protein [Haloplasma contractile SSD-17B]